MISAILGLFSSGFGGGLFGGIFGLAKQFLERGERAQQRKDDLDRDRLEYDNADKERSHALVMLNRAAELNLEQSKVEAAADLAETEAETEAEVAVANQKALNSAQDVFKNLKTSKGMDNYRGSVRPTLAFYYTILFSAILWWFFDDYAGVITDEEGKSILLALIATLNFTVTSIVTFYYVSRRNSAPKL